ncbi:MAG: bifunctional hydroxymethylpyrimidine kinase/phosphomethylpyrimidine kinase [Deltaproteobacteria bacterium]|nr:bifunctional hydroxymethylpyrimidine kinase/phosphomethylpyrimidine kinase [Deltaproteobacteria bacterium]
MKPPVLVIAGLDPSGGAGILRDARAVNSAGVDCRVVATSLTAQDENSFDRFEDVSPDMVEAQFKAAVRSRHPAAVKVGMLGSRANCEAVARLLRGLKTRPPLVVDPVLAASSGGNLTDDSDLASLRDHMIPLASLVTPNVPEAAVLARMDITGVEQMESAAVTILRMGAGAVLVKGGHLKSETVTDVLAIKGESVRLLRHERLPRGIHGSGCLLSSTAAAHLALGSSLAEAVQLGIDAVVNEIGL